MRKPTAAEFDTYKRLEIEFYSQHKAYHTLLQDIDPRKRDLHKEFLTLLRERNAYFRFAEVDGEITGYIYGVLRSAGENEKNWQQIADLNSIIVLRKYRNRGIATYMTKEFFAWLKTKHIHYVEASCNIKNDAIMKFNNELGFQEQHIKYGKVL